MSRDEGTENGENGEDECEHEHEHVPSRSLFNVKERIRARQKEGNETHNRDHLLLSEPRPLLSFSILLHSLRFLSCALSHLPFCIRRHVLRPPLPQFPPQLPGPHPRLACS